MGGGVTGLVTVFSDTCSCCDWLLDLSLLLLFLKTEPKQDKSFSFIFHLFRPFICCLSVVLWLDEGDFPENLHTVCLCLHKRSFEPFCVLDLVLERQQSFCFSFVVVVVVV